MLFYSPDFPDGDPIPKIYTCEAEDISPTLKWENIPKEAKSLVLIVDDPDAPDPAAPKMTWVHWILYNLPTNTSGLKSNIGHGLPVGTFEGVNDWKRIGYGGPCPPIGRHRYFFKLYAIDSILPNLNKPTKEMLLKNIENKIVATASFVGTYKKSL